MQINLPAPRKRNGRGDNLSEKRELRRALCGQFNVTTGRQWRRLRRQVRRELTARGITVGAKRDALELRKPAPAPKRASDEAVKARPEARTPGARRPVSLAAISMLAAASLAPFRGSR
jgi:hypothetical protein